MRLARSAAIVVAIVAVGSVASAAGPLPEGWVDDAPRQGSLRTVRHVESSAGLDVLRLQLSPDDVERFQRNLTTQLTADGFDVEVPASPTTLGAGTGTMTRYTRTVMEVQFTVIVVDIYHKNSLLHAVAWLRPTEDVTEEALESDVLTIVGALVK